MNFEDIKEDLVEFLKSNLTIDVKTTSEYVGSLGNGDGSLYKDNHTLTLVLAGETISEVYL